jgi:hypothetical protein
MKTFTNMAAQGDFIIMRVKSLPKDLVEIAPENGKHIVAHSETGHNHVMEAEHVTVFKEAKETDDSKLFQLFFSVKQDTTIDHLRSFDTHETLLVPPGDYVVKRQREYVAEGFRKAAD